MSWILNSDFIPPAKLTGLIRQALFDLQINKFTLSRWLPNVDIDDVQYEFTKGGQGLAEASVYRSWDAESPIGRREGLSKVLGELPPISEKIPLGEYDRLRLRKVTDDTLLPFIARDAQRLARNIGARLELARGDALANGSVTINENGVQQTVSYGRSGDHSVFAGVLWDDLDDAVPLDDLESWLQTYQNTNGEAPGKILMPLAIRSYLRRNAQIKGMVYPNVPVSGAPMVSDDAADAVFRSLGIPPIETYDAQVKVDGTAQRITPANKIIFLPAEGSSSATSPTDLGATMLGTTAEALEAEYGLVGEQPGVVAAQYKSRDPIRLWTHAAAIALPVLREPDLTFVARVLA
jgi:hypothetical protein